MKQLHFVFLVVTNISFSQNKLDCFKDVYYEEVNNDLTVIIKKELLKFIEPINASPYKSCKISIDCTNNYLNLIYEFQNGNEYKFVNNIFKVSNDSFYLTNVFILYTNRYSTSLTGSNCLKIKLENFVNKFDSIEESLNNKEISNVTGHQEEKEIEEIPYYNLIKKSYCKKEFSDVRLFTNEFVIEKLGIAENFSINELNDIAYFAYKSNGYDEGLYILKKVIEKSPKRVVAYLNIADCYWETNEKEKAKENYKKYIQLMKDQKKDLKRIPKYVLERTKQ